MMQSVNEYKYVTKQCKMEYETKQSKTTQMKWWFTSLFRYFNTIQKWNEMGDGMTQKSREWEANTYSHSRTMRAMCIIL